MVFEFKIEHPEDGVIKSGQIAFTDEDAARSELRSRLATRQGIDNETGELTTDDDGNPVPKYGPAYAEACTISLDRIR